MKFVVVVPEVHLSHVEVEANSPKEAFELVKKCEGDSEIIILDYDRTLEPSEYGWEVYSNTDKNISVRFEE